MRNFERVLFVKSTCACGFFDSQKLNMAKNNSFYKLFPEICYSPPTVFKDTTTDTKNMCKFLFDRQ